MDRSIRQHRTDPIRSTLMHMGRSIDRIPVHRLRSILVVASAVSHVYMGRLNTLDRAPAGIESVPVPVDNRSAPEPAGT